LTLYRDQGWSLSRVNGAKSVVGHFSRSWKFMKRKKRKKHPATRPSANPAGNGNTYRK
jgi:hypothetical protein